MLPKASAGLSGTPRHYAKLSRDMRAPWVKSIVILCLKSGADPPLRSLRVAWLEGIVTSGRQQRNAEADRPEPWGPSQ